MQNTSAALAYERRALSVLKSARAEQETSLTGAASGEAAAQPVLPSPQRRFQSRAFAVSGAASPAKRLRRGRC